MTAPATPSTTPSLTADAVTQAALAYDRAALSPRLTAAEAERAEILKRFPKDGWETMPLERYALGQRDSEDTYCRWLEFRSDDLGSILGGSAMKMVIFKRRDQDGWYYPEAHFASLEEAWTTLRHSFAEAFRLADAGDWEAIDFLPGLDFCPALRVKSLHVYYPAEILPIYGDSALRHFLRVFGHPDADKRSLRRIALNRTLLAAVRAHPVLRDWSTNEVQFFLYDAFAPQEARRIVKIAPGENAKYWADCVAGGYICVGWDAVGDLSDFKAKSEFRERFYEVFGELYRHNKSKLSAKANELWTLRELSPGDIVVANHGTSKLLAIGEVVEPGYEWRGDREHFRHTVHVRWDTSVASTIDPQPSWATVTVAKVAPTLYEAILSGQPSRNGNRDRPQPPLPNTLLEPELLELAETLDRKRQLILYGPPGTGKTYTARRLSVAFLLRHDGRDAAVTLADPVRFASVERELAGLPERDAAREDLLPYRNDGVAPLTMLTFHPSYSYEDFIEGFRPYDNGTGSLALHLEDGVFKRVCIEASAHPERRYVVLIDEINRANLGKVFGEIVTLLERDKRGMVITLPQSKASFAVPANVYIVGTMNTADRSIKLLDAALRRRFAFAEIMPDAELLRGAKVGTLALDEFLEELNRRIAREAGREKQIGHSFLLDGDTPVTEPEEFARRFRQEILPLLQEYCYEDYAALATYLGTELVDREAGTIDTDIVHDPTSLIAALEKEFARGEMAG